MAKAPVQTFYLARQPIYDGGLRVAGYELLFRDGDDAQSGFRDGDRAASEVMSFAPADIGLDVLVRQHPAFVCTPRRALGGELPLSEHRGRIVLEVRGDEPVDAALVSRLEALSRAGYRIALDDFVFRPGCDALLAVAHYVKLDVQTLSAAELADQVARLRAHPPRLIAAKVETHEMLAACQALGFDLYQGFFFCRPRAVRGRRPEPNRLAVLQLITRLQDPDAGIDELERLVSCDPALCYRLLKYINSAYCGLRVEVGSIRQALVMVGTSRLRGWATLLLVSRLSDGKPSELITTALIRARFCELLGGCDEARDDGQYFTVGLLSVLDALLDLPMRGVVDDLPLDAEVCAALCDHAGPLGVTLASVLAYERGADTAPDTGAAAGPAYVEALRWAVETEETLVA